MSFAEFVGFIISITAMIFLMIKGFFESRKRRIHSEKGHANVLKMPEPKKITANSNKRREMPKTPIASKKGKNIPALPQENYGCETAREKKMNLAASDEAYSIRHRLKSAENYEVIRIESISSGQELIGRLKSPQDMVILKEIFDKPLSMRD